MTNVRRFHPSIPAIAFIIWWIVASVVFPDRMLNADGDMLRHIGHGDWMLEHGRLITEDPFSFTRGGQPFTAFEYGSQLTLALVHNAAGLAGIAIFAGLLIATAYALLARFLLSRGVDAFLAYLVSVAAALLGAVHWAARPHLFTLVGVVVVWHFLEDGSAGRADAVHPYRNPLTGGWQRYVAAGLLFGLWANLHGGFIFGLALFGIYFAGSVAEMFTAGSEARAQWRARAVDYLGLGAAATAGTFLTPHGWKLHLHIVEFFGPESQFLLDNTQEFLSPDFHSLVGKLLLLGILGAVVTMVLARERPDFRRLLLVLAMIYFALDARRNIQLFGATVLPALALQYDYGWRRLSVGKRIREVFDRDAKVASTWPYVGIMLLLFGVVAAARGTVAGMKVVPHALSPLEFPIALVERARAERWQGRLIHDFVWGGYLVYAWPEQKVFIDGGTDFYGPELMRTYMDISDLRPFWRDSLARWEIDRALLPTGSALAHELLREPGWTLKACDATGAFMELAGWPTPKGDADSALAACSQVSPE